MKKKSNSRLFAATVLAALIIPLAAVLLLGSLAVITETDVAYPEIISRALYYLKELVCVLSVFAASGCLVYSFVNGYGRSCCAAVCFVSIPLVYIVSAMADSAFYGDQALSAVYLIPMVINSLFEALRYLIVILVTRMIGKNAKGSGRSFGLELFSLEGALSRGVFFGTLTVFATLIVTSLTDTLSLLAEFGAPVNLSELIYLILPYPTAIVYSVIGYFVMFAAVSFCMKNMKGKK